MQRKAADLNPAAGRSIGFPEPELRADQDIGVFRLRPDRSWELIRRYKPTPTYERLARNRALTLVRRERCLVRLAAMPAHILDPSRVIAEYDTR